MTIHLNLLYVAITIGVLCGGWFLMVAFGFGGWQGLKPAIDTVIVGVLYGAVVCFVALVVLLGLNSVFR